MEHVYFLWQWTLLHTGSSVCECVSVVQSTKSDAEQAIQATTGGWILASPGVPVLKSEWIWPKTWMYLPVFANVCVWDRKRVLDWRGILWARSRLSPALKLFCRFVYTFNNSRSNVDDVTSCILIHLILHSFQKILVIPSFCALVQYYLYISI